MLGHQPPGRDTFEEVAERYLKHQKARLTPKAYDREEGIVRKHLNPKFGARKPAFLQEAVGKLDAVFGSPEEPNLVENREERHRSVTGQKALSE
jgi:hypothetical protein